MAITVVLGLIFSLATTFVSVALLVRTWFGRVPRGVTFLPVPLVLYNLWVLVWFVFECLRQFLATRMAPSTALQLMAGVLLAASLSSVGWLYACVSVVHRFLDDTASRRARRAVGYGSLLLGALLIGGWVAFHYGDDDALFILVRGTTSILVPPLALAAAVWLAARVRHLTDPWWRARVTRLARQYVTLFAVIFVVAAVRDRLRAVAPALPLVIDAGLALIYTLATVLWVEGLEGADGSRPPYQAMP